MNLHLFFNLFEIVDKYFAIFDVSDYSYSTKPFRVFIYIIFPSFQKMESPKTDKIPGSTGVEAQPEDNLDKNELKDEITTTTAAVKLEPEENSKVNGESLSVAIASELKKDIVDYVVSANPKPNENGIVREVKKKPEIVSNDREFVLTPKNLERDSVRKEPGHRRISPPKQPSKLLSKMILDRPNCFGRVQIIFGQVQISLFCPK